MKTIESPLNSKVLASYNISIGDIYIFENFIVAEYNEGLHLKFDDYHEVINIIDKHFGSKPFGFIANRVNAYSLVLTEANKFQEALPNLMAYAVVYYSVLARKNVDLEKRFYTFNRESFGDLSSAVDWILIELKESSLQEF